MRFLMLNWRDPNNPMAGGAERVSLANLAALVERGHEVYWFANDFPGAAKEETLAGIRLVRGGGKGTSIGRAIQWYRRQQPFDLVIDQHHGIPWYAPWWCRTRSIAFIHEVLGPIWRTFYPRPIAVLGQWQERWTHWLYRHVTFWTVCESTRDTLMRHGVKQVQVIYNGTDTRALPMLDDKPLKQPLRLVMVSRLAPNKRIEHGILTLAELTKRGISAHLTIVGGGEEEARLRVMAAQLQLAGLVRFAGVLAEADKDRVLRDAHFLLHTSVREGWGLNVIEANAMGTPGAVYPVPGLKESTLHDQTGLVATAETPRALANQLAGILTDDSRYQRYRTAAWQRAKEMHWERVLPKTCDWLEQQARK